MSSWPAEVEDLVNALADCMVANVLVDSASRQYDKIPPSVASKPQSDSVLYYAKGAAGEVEQRMSRALTKLVGQHADLDVGLVRHKAETLCKARLQKITFADVKFV